MDETERKNIIASIQALLEIEEPDVKEDAADYAFAFNINDPFLFAQDVGAWAERCPDGQEAAFFKHVIRRCAQFIEERKKPAGRPRKRDWAELLAHNEEWERTKGNPGWSDREYARKHMGAATEKDIHAAVEELRRARAWHSQGRPTKLK
jgi:hypothetical protein